MKHRARSRTIPQKVVERQKKLEPTQAQIVAAALTTAAHGIHHQPGERADLCDKCKAQANGKA